jgi:hypothetical protein
MINIERPKLLVWPYPNENRIPGDLRVFEKWSKRFLKKWEKREGRTAQWTKAIARNALFQTNQKDRKVKYDETDCEYHRINRHLDVQGTLDTCHASHFFRAAWMHRNHVLYELLPEVGLMASQGV